MTLDRDGRHMVTQYEASALRQNGCHLTNEWWDDADHYINGDITLNEWRLRNTARGTQNLEHALKEQT